MFLILHNQLFPLEHLSRHAKSPFFLFEDFDLWNKFKFHKQKIVFEIASIRTYAESLQKKGFDIVLEKIKPGRSMEEGLRDIIQQHSIKNLKTFEIEDRTVEARLSTFCDQNKIKLSFEKSPMFLTTRKEFKAYLKAAEESNTRPLMRSFYQERRKKLKILVDKKGEPAGGRFSYDNLNPIRLSKEIQPPTVPRFQPSAAVKEAMALVQQLFPDNPGSLKDFWWPTSREQALSWLDDFIRKRLARYGDYEDSLSSHSDLSFQSALGAALNIGLLTPTEVIHQALEGTTKFDIPLQSLEGFIRGILGWREYMRGIYQNFGDELPETHFFKHSRKLKSCWYEGTTGLPVLDETIRKALKLGYTRPMERLMIISNLMLLCEVSPEDAFRWFMEMHTDSAEWVTAPNVFGLGQFSDGGLVSTRPYICASAYIRNMSYYETGPWCDILDGLYWGFVEKNQSVFAKNPRIAGALASLRKLDPDRKEKIFSVAQKFKEQVTSSG